MNSDRSKELRQILSHYALGELVDYRRDERGTVNTSFTIDLLSHGEPKRYFLRRYKKGIKEEELLFEHSLLTHLLAKNFMLVSRVHPTRDGRTYLKSDGDETIFYAIFDYLEGEDKYTWISPQCNSSEVISSAEALAGFHRAISGWIPQGQRHEPRIVDLLPTLPGIVDDILQMGRQDAFTDYLQANRDLILEHIGEILNILHQPEYQALPQLVIHCDYHPGNLKFADGKVVAMFDFDWSKVDARCFDVGLAIVYFFSSWDEADDGQLRLEDMWLFLRSYQRRLADDSGIGALSLAEQMLLPALIAAGNLYVMNWALLDYAHKPVDAQEFLGYLRHHVQMIPWLGQADSQAELERAIQRACALPE
jgi:homoserine kinase type II